MNILITIKLNWANAKLYKVRRLVNIRILKLIYHAILDCYLNYAKQYEVKTKKSLTQLFILQKKALRLISFICRNIHSKPHFYKHEIIESSEKIIIENCIFCSKSINFDLPSICNHWFTFSSDYNRYETSCSSREILKVKISITKKHKREALIKSAISTWNDIQKKISSNKMQHNIPSFKLT